MKSHILVSRTLHPQWQPSNAGAGAGSVYADTETAIGSGVACILLWYWIPPVAVKNLPYDATLNDPEIVRGLTQIHSLGHCLHSAFDVR